MLHSLIPALTRIFGCVPTVKHFPITYATTSLGTGALLCTLRASTARPLLVKTNVEITTVFNATTTNTLQIGTSANGSQLITTALLTATTTGFYPLQVTATAQPGMLRITANTTIYATFYGVKATGTLTSDNTAPSDGDTVTIGSTTYTFKTALTPTAGEVLINSTADAALLNLIRAINHSGTAGTDYANSGVTAVANTQVTAATSVTSHAFAVTSILGGTQGHYVSTETSAHLSWGAAALAGGTDTTAGAANVILTVTPLFQGT